ncbi:MAG: ABC transporter permease [Nitrospiria bacterium]
MTRVWAFVERDIRKFMRNPLTIFSSVFLPIVYLLVIGNSFQGTLKDLPIAVVDQDHGPYAKRLLKRMQAVEAGPHTVDLVVMLDTGVAESAVRSGKIKGALVIPPHFSKDVIRGTTPQIGLVIDNTDSVSAAALTQSINAAFAYLKVDAVPVRPDRRIPQLRSIELYKRVDYDASIVPGAVIMAVFMGTMTTGGFNLVMDRFLGVHESYLSTPLTKRELVFGIIISGVFVTTVIALIVLGAGIWLTALEVATGLGSFLAVVMVIALSSMGLLSMMCVFLARVDHPRIVGLFGGFLNIIFFFPSGAVYPVESFPPWLRAFSKINPESYAVHALKSILFKGVEWQAVQGDLIFLLGFTGAMFFLSTATFKRTL